MKDKAKIMNSILMQRRKLGVPIMHKGGFYVLQNGSVAVCVEAMHKQDMQGTSLMAAMMGANSSKKEAWQQETEDPIVGWGCCVVVSTNPHYKVGAGFVVDADVDCEYLDLTPINEVEIDFKRMVLKENDIGA